MRRLFGWLLVIHLILAVALTLTLALDMPSPELSRIHNALVDGYEFVGLGVYTVGLGIVTLVLGLAWWRAGKPAPRAG